MKETAMLFVTMTRRYRMLFPSLLVMSLFLSACGHAPVTQDTMLKIQRPVSAMAMPEGGSGAPVVEASSSPAVQPAPENNSPETASIASYTATSVTEGKTTDSPITLSKSNRVQVAADEMPLYDFVYYIFSDIFSANYIVDDDIRSMKENITLNLKEGISEYDLFWVVRDMLEKKKVSVTEKENTYYIWKGSVSTGVSVGVGTELEDIPSTTGEIQQIVPVKYMDVQYLYELLPKVKDLNIRFLTDQNILVFSGSRQEVSQYLTLIRTVDQPIMRGKHIGLVQIHYWSLDEMIEQLEATLGREGISVTTNYNLKGLYIHKIERQGALILFSPQQNWIDRAREWIRLLDTPSDKVEKQFFTYVPKNARAVELGESLEKILGYTTSTASDTTFAGKVADTTEKTSGSTVGSVGGTMVADVDMVVDGNRNMIIFYTTQEKFAMLTPLLTKLDIMPVQVLLEATIAEVTLTGSLQHGIEWYVKSTDSSTDSTSVWSTLGGLGLGSGGLDYSFVTDSDKISALINALAEDDMVKIISSPRLTVRDGKNAKMNVGTEVPIITSETSSSTVDSDGSTGIVRSVQYRSTGVTLDITPSVQSEGLVTLEISQELSEAQANTTSDISSPIILNRTVETEVVSADGQTVLLGGLIKENNSATVTKVPFFGDLPILGHLFRTNSKGSDRTEMVILITPHIIRSTEQIDEMRETIFDMFDNIAYGFE